MIEGIVWAIAAGVMLGFYALPEKFTKEFEFENTWGLFFTTALTIVPILVTFGMVEGMTDVLAAIPGDTIVKMALASILWGVGVMMWGKAINYIGLSLGFSIFIGTIILVGTLLPFLVDGLPRTDVLTMILIGVFVVLIGVMANGRAGIQRQKDESNDDSEVKGGSMMIGILIAVVGGLLATGFSLANAIGRPVIEKAVVAQGNPGWMVALVIMFIIYLSGAIFVVPYFAIQISKKKLWSNFKTAPMGRNLACTSTMAILNFVASVAFAYAAFRLGKAGNSVGYAIYNTVSVMVAVMSGIVTKEWVHASVKTKRTLYFGFAAMVVGVLVIAFGNGLA